MTMSSLLAAVTGTGARCPLGLSSLQATMCTRARKAEPRSTAFRDKRGRFIGASTTPGLLRDCHGPDRLLALASPALREAAGAPPARAWPLFLALPEPGRPDDDSQLDGAIVQALSRESGVALDERLSRTIRAGHAGFAFALAEAVSLLSHGADDVLVGGADSYYHPDVLASLDRECRLHALGAEDGFVPSEGAAFLRLSRRAPGGAELARLVHVETGREETVLSGQPNTASTMTRLLARAAAASSGGKLGWVLPDVNGERHRVREWALATRRGSLADGCVEERLASELGDMGAALGATLAVLACELFRASGAPRGEACIALHAEGAERAVFLLASPPDQRWGLRSGEPNYAPKPPEVR
jgi:3-oxoacyl-[acyl-carrier-protein] synthase I